MLFYQDGGRSSSYSRLQDQIGAGLKNEEKRLVALTKKYLTKRTRKAINNLFKVERAFYNITELKVSYR